MASRKAVDEWGQSITKYVGIAGLLYELLVDKLRNPTALVIFGGLAGLPNVLGYREAVKQSIEREKQNER
jgi:hypothetical protein